MLEQLVQKRPLLTIKLKKRQPNCSMYYDIISNLGIWANVYAGARVHPRKASIRQKHSFRKKETDKKKHALVLRVARPSIWKIEIDKF